MKIVNICLNGPVTDGWNYQDNLLTKYQCKNGYDVTIITSQWVWGTNGKLEKCEKSDYINIDGVKMIRLPIIGKDDHFRKFKRYSGLRRRIEMEKPDILFVHGISFLDSSIIADYCKKNHNVALYVDNHMDFSNSGTNWLSRNVLHKLIWRHQAKKLEPYTKKFYGVLPARVNWLIDMYGLPKEKCELLVMGADDENVVEASNPEVRKKVRKKYGINDDDFLIITGGKIDKWKRQTLLLMEAVKEIPNLNVKLIVFGSVSEDLKDRVNELSDGEKVIYAGWVESRKSYDMFAASDLVVFPGRHSVFWEQVAGQGIPMICKYWEGTTHINVNNNVVFLMEDSTEVIKKTIKHFIEDKTFYKNIKDNAVKAAKTFRYSEIARRSIEEGEKQCY